MCRALLYFYFLKNIVIFLFLVSLYTVVLRLTIVLPLKENRDLAEFMKSDNINLLWNLANVDQVMKCIIVYLFQPFYTIFLSLLLPGYSKP